MLDSLNGTFEGASLSQDHLVSSEASRPKGEKGRGENDAVMSIIALVGNIPSEWKFALPASSLASSLTENNMVATAATRLLLECNHAIIVTIVVIITSGYIVM